MSRIAWVVQNMVPYHHARFEAFAARHDGEVHLVQTTEKDTFDVLEFSAEEASYHLHTLFPGRNRASISPEELRTNIFNALDGVQPDCVCVSGWGMKIGQCAELWAILREVPVVMFSVSTAHDAERFWWKEKIKSVLLKAASAAFVGGIAQKAYVEQLGMPAERIFCGHNVVDGAHFSRVQEKRPSVMPALLEDSFFYVTCARFSPKKNIPFLIEAFAGYREICKQQNKDPGYLVIAGDGPLRLEIEQSIEKYQVGAHVLLLGLVEYDDLPWLYQHCAAYIQASTTEQWGLVVNEAMAAGAPVLLSERCGCVQDLVEKGRNGDAFDPYDLPDMIRSLVQFRDLDEEARKSYKQKSKDIISHWTPEQYAVELSKAVELSGKLGPFKKPGLAKVLLQMLTRQG